jgi:hypothetical protein
MPVGRFRTDPTELDDAERQVSARQYPEGALVVGMGIGVAAPFLVQQFALSIALLSSPVGTALGPLVGGVAGYLLGHQYKQYRIRVHRERSRETEAESGTRPARGRS